MLACLSNDTLSFYHLLLVSRQYVQFCEILIEDVTYLNENFYLISISYLKTFYLKKTNFLLKQSLQSLNHGFIEKSLNTKFSINFFLNFGFKYIVLYMYKFII